jgi:acyl-CoA synthetase (NDP forming)
MTTAIIERIVMVLGLFKKKAAPKTAPKTKPTHAPKPVVKKVIQMPHHKPAAKAKPKPVKPVAKVVPAKRPVLPTIEKVPDEKAYEMLKAAKIPVVPYIIVKSEKDLPEAFKKIGFPLVLKASGKNIIHKTELGGVKFATNGGAAIAAFHELMKIKGCEKVLAQKKLGGLEIIVGAKADPQFGAVVSIGIGGTYVEILKDVTFRVAPITVSDAMAMIKELKGYEILAGARGQPAINLNTLSEVLVKVGNLAIREKIKEMDINPLFCTTEGCWAADVRIVK